MSDHGPLDNETSNDPATGVLPDTPIQQAKDALGAQSSAGAVDKAAVIEQSGNVDKPANSDKHEQSLWRRFFGTRLRLIVTGVVTLIIAPAVGAILATAVPPIWSSIQSSGQNQDRATQVIFYEPWDTDNFNGTSLSSNVRIHRTTAGYCWNDSVVSSRTDAFRCETTDNAAIMDPCFAYPFLPISEITEVACPNPGPSSVTVIKLTHRLPLAGVAPGNPHLPTNFWLVTLADGTSCHAGGGTVDTIGNQVSGSYYYCPGVDFSLYGYPVQGNPIWTILEQQKAVSDIEPAQISKAYR